MNIMFPEESRTADRLRQRTGLAYAAAAFNGRQLVQEVLQRVFCS
jgi:hypothetical protein